MSDDNNNNNNSNNNTTLSLQFDVVYDGSLLASPKQESSPVLMFWTSLPGRKKQYYPVKWANRAKTLSRKIPVALQISALNARNEIPRDSSIGIQAKVSTPNKSGQSTLQNVGDALLPLGIWMANGKFPDELKTDLSFHVFTGKDGERVVKGHAILSNFSVRDPATSEEVSLTVDKSREITEFDYLACNEQFFASVVQSMVARGILMFTEEAKASGFAFSADSKEVQRVHAPFSNRVAGLLPGSTFVLRPGPKAPKLGSDSHARVEAWLQSILSYALGRENMQASAFSNVIEQQLKRADATYDDELTNCANVLGQMIAIPPTSMPYIGDFVYSDSKKRLDSMNSANGYPRLDNEQMHGVERFSEMCENDGGDCDDGACFSCRIATTLSEGEWESRELQAAARLCRLYVPTLNLGSVLSAALGNDNGDGKSARKEDVIDSKADRDVTYGAHMWCELMPVAKFVALVKRSVPAMNIDLMMPSNTPRPPWMAALPHLVSEGTGRLSSLQLPRVSYVVNDDRNMAKRKAIIVAEQNYRKLMSHLIANTQTLGKMTTVRRQKTLLNEPNRRVNKFYRNTTHCFTSFFVNKGLDVFNFLYANKGARTPATGNSGRLFEAGPLQSALNSSVGGAETPDLLELIGGPASERREGKFKYGVPMYDKLQMPLLPSTALVPVATVSARDARVIATLMRHSPPITTPGDWAEIDEMHRARIESLKSNKGADFLAAERSQLALFDLLKERLPSATGRPANKSWPIKQSRKWTLATLIFDAKLLTSEPVVAAILSDVEGQVKQGVVKYARASLETPMPHRNDVCLQLLCDATKLK